MPQARRRPPLAGDGPLLIACALAIERLALHGGRPSGRSGRFGGPHTTVLRTGMGPRSAERAVAGILRAERGPRPTTVVASGFCAGLVPGMHPGDLVVADETWDPEGRTRCTGVERLAEVLTQRAARPGRWSGGEGHRRTVHTGALAGADHLVRAAERGTLRDTGAIAVDMESAVTLRTALRCGPRPVAAVRVVVDAPGHELIRFQTLRGGVSAFHALRAVYPVLFEWHRSQLLLWR